MKQLESLRKRLPKGIDVRINSGNILTFRARFRKRVYPEETKTFSDPKLAKKWLAEQQRNADIGIHLPHLKASKRTLAEAVAVTWKLFFRESLLIKQTQLDI